MFWSLEGSVSHLEQHAKYKQYRQRLVVSVCCVLHNFICINNRSDVLFNMWENLGRDDIQTGNSGNSPESSASTEMRHVRDMSNASKRVMGEFRDDITDHIWEEYVRRRR